MVRHCTAERLILCTTCGLAANEVRICTAKTGRANHLVTIEHYLVFSSLLHHIHIVIDERLAVVMLSDRKDITNITALDRIIAILVHKIKSLIEVTLVVTYR